MIVMMIQVVPNTAAIAERFYATVYQAFADGSGK